MRSRGRGSRRAISSRYSSAPHSSRSRSRHAAVCATRDQPRSTHAFWVAGCGWTCELARAGGALGAARTIQRALMRRLYRMSVRPRGRAVRPQLRGDGIRPVTGCRPPALACSALPRRRTPALLHPGHAGMTRPTARTRAVAGRRVARPVAFRFGDEPFLPCGAAPRRAASAWLSHRPAQRGPSHGFLSPGHHRPAGHSCSIWIGNLLPRSGAGGRAAVQGAFNGGTREAPASIQRARGSTARSATISATSKI